MPKGLNRSCSKEISRLKPFYINLLKVFLSRLTKSECSWKFLSFRPFGEVECINMRYCLFLVWGVFLYITISTSNHGDVTFNVFVVEISLHSCRYINRELAQEVELVLVHLYWCATQRCFHWESKSELVMQLHSRRQGLRPLLYRKFFLGMFWVPTLGKLQPASSHWSRPVQYCGLYCC